MKIDANNPRWQRMERLGWKQGPHGVMNLASGDTYTGMWRDNLKHGNGVYQSTATKQSYEGEFKFDKRDGFGILSVLRNQKNSDQKIDSLFEDKSKQKFKMVNTQISADMLTILYTGEWSGDKRNGHGSEFLHDCLFEGSFRDDLREGWGKASYKNGKVYEGEYHNNKRHGQGVLIENNGDRYEGTWMDGMKEGPGKFIYLSKKQLYEGEWHKDLPICGVLLQFPGQEQAHPFPKNELKDFKLVLDEAKYEIQCMRERAVLHV